MPKADLEKLLETKAKRKEKLKREQLRAREADQRVTKEEDRLRGVANEGVAQAVKEMCSGHAEVIKVKVLRTMAEAKLAQCPGALRFLDDILPPETNIPSTPAQQDPHLAGEPSETDCARL